MMKLITDPAGVSHLMAEAETRAAIHRTASTYCKLQIIRRELFEPKSGRWNADTQFYFMSLSDTLGAQAEVISAGRFWGRQ